MNIRLKEKDRWTKRTECVCIARTMADGLIHCLAQSRPTLDSITMTIHISLERRMSYKTGKSSNQRVLIDFLIKGRKRVNF
jgi:hypothetical protein